MIKKNLVENYASALFENACAGSLEEAVLEQIKSIDQLIQGNPEIKNIIFSPTAKYSYKLKIIELIVQNLQAEAIVKQFLLILLQHSRISILSDIVDLYQTLLNKSRNIKIVKITSSKPLQEEEKRWLQQYLEEDFQQKVEIKFVYNPTIIGGIIIEYDSLIKDYSIAGALKKVNKVLTNGNFFKVT